MFQPPQHELTDFTDYVITENFTTNMKFPSGAHIEDPGCACERGRQAHGSQREEQRDLLNLKGLGLKGASTRPPFSGAYFLHLRLFEGWKARALPLPRETTL